MKRHDLYAADWQPTKKKLEDDKVDELTDTFTQAVHLLWNLCESNSVAVKYFNNGNLLPVLVKCLEVDVFGVDTTIAVAHCLLIVTEDNPTSVSKLQGFSTSIHKLLELEGSESATLLLRTLACGLVLNLNYGKVLSLSPTIMTQLLCNLSTTLSVDHRKVLNSFTSSLPLNEVVETPTHHEEVLKSVTVMEYLLEAQKIAVELLANICSDDDADEDAMDQDSSDSCSDGLLSDSELVEEDDIPSTEKLCLSIPSEVHEAIVSGQLVQKILENTQLPAENVCEILKSHVDGKHVFNKLLTLRCHALLCLSNLLAGLDIQDLGGPKNVYEMWRSIGSLIFKQPEVTDTRFLEAATSALRATLQKLAEVQCNLFGQLTESDLQLMFNTVLQCPDTNVRANLIRSVGMLGMILVNSVEPDGQTLLKNIGKFLLEVCGRESELWVVAEAVDTVIDVFGEDETDNAAAHINLVEKLKALLPSLKHKVRLQRKSLGDHYLVVTTVNTNLCRFIKYKSKRVSHIGQPNGHDL
ncbi:HEAT repeat-containing protein 3 [Zootermopsis nevadensis]|uniref:HEAT repeat-containing protein 3 n=1 Tax=Zootermopsis nevadensis TaxID=136037 RepID=A0A067QKG1_ZOONE|nr:HEAT repeat-containing protein 3 [Zootermopsis nevadensis]